MIKYSIKDLEKITGIKAHTIRIWEKRYGIVKPSRTETNIRFYSDEDLRHLMNVAILNKFGYKISNIQSMSVAEVAKSVLELSNQDIDNDHLVDNLVMAMIELDEQRFDKIISSAIIKNGFDDTFEHLLRQFLEKIGVLWQTGSVNPAQEHFISQLIRQKLILAIDGQHDQKANHKTFLLFLPEQEYHEMALLYMYYLIRKAGHQVIYLGQNVPLINLKDIFEIHKIDFLLTSLTANLDAADISGFFEEFRLLYGNRQILMGGSCLQNNSELLPPNATYFKSIAEFTDFLHKL
jgi:MerR family transcriptional regulator, light-induced transcriptional regulator